MTSILTRNRTAEISKVPKPPFRRSIFDINYSRKQTFNASYLVPILCKRVVPGQSLFLNMSYFIRLTTQLVCPIDNLQVETFFFYGPDRILWDNSNYFVGAVEDPNNPKEYMMPQIEIPQEKNTAGSLFNLLSASRLGKKAKVSKLPFVLHNLIWNEYFRDSDCQSPKKVDKTDADGDINDYDLYRIHKSRDYFTNSTRDLQEGNPVNVPIGTTAPVIGDSRPLGIWISPNETRYLAGGVGTAQNCMVFGEYDEGNPQIGTQISGYTAPGNKLAGISNDPNKSGLIALLNDASGASLNVFAQALMTNEYLQALNRGGTKYVDVMRNIYGVTIPDLTIQRPLYLGGTSKAFPTIPVVQTSGTGIGEEETPQGNIAGYGVNADRGRIISKSFLEFGWVIGYVVIKAQPQYQQGIDRQWLEKDRYDLFNPFFNNAPDQAIQMQEIYQYDYDENDEMGTPKNEKVFGYIGRNDHMRYLKNEIAGELNSEYKYPLDIWHYAEKFETEPANNSDFMEDKTYEILDRTLAIKWENQEKSIKSPQFIADFSFVGANALPIPTHAIPKISSFM